MKARLGQRLVACVVMLGASIAIIQQAAAQTTGIETESVNNYGDDGGNLAHSNASAANFLTGMVDASTSAETYIYWRGSSWEDGLVYDTDFHDPDVTGNTLDDDTGNFDQSGNSQVIAFYQGHGWCLADASYQPTPYVGCKHASDCSGLSAPTGWSGPATCTAYPGVSGYTSSSDPGLCSWWFYPTAPVYGNQTQHLQSVTWGYGSSGVRGGVAFGESSVEHWYANAAQNGGINLAIIHQSCGAHVNEYFTEFYQMFAGLHIVAAMMPQWGSDTIDDALYGGVVAMVYADNAYSSVASGVTKFVEQNEPQGNGGYCPRTASNYSEGGGHGYNGCACDLSFSTDGTNAGAYFKQQTENWSELQNNFYDATGEGYWYYNVWCNYDTTTYPLSL